MCVVCLLWEQEKLKAYEVRSALTEMVNTDPDLSQKHIDEIIEKLQKVEKAQEQEGVA